MRISRPQMWMEMAQVLAKRSTCFRGNVGALLVKDNNVISCGYNGPPSGEEHCTGNGCFSPGSGCHRSDHAEYNAIHRAGVLGAFEAELYVTLSPCMACAEEIVKMKLASVTFATAYRDRKGIDYLIISGIPTFRLTPSGYLINEETQEIHTGT